ncbi:MAG: WD40 repeat domain-containing protein, partial [Chloroflexi bacterium]|nr:WD40 repeat domain-containing protein [Chloroflexota bacterium]
IPDSVDWTQDEHRAVLAWTASNEQAQAAIWDFDTQEVVQRLVHPTDRLITRVRWSHDETRIATAAEDGLARIWDVQSGTLLVEMEVGLTSFGEPAFVNDIQWSRNDQFIVTIDEIDQVIIWDAETGTRLVILPLEGRQSLLSRIDWMDNGQRLAIGDGLGSVIIWDIQSGTPVLEPLMHMGQVTEVIWNEAEDQLLTSSSDGLVRLWDAQSGALLQEFTGHQSGVRYAGWSPDEQLIFSAGFDGSIRAWDIESGEETLFIENAYAGAEVFLSADASELLLFTRQGRLAIWQIEVERLAALVQTRLENLGVPLDTTP